MKQKLKYYSLKNILAKNAHYNMIIGERSNGKTYSVLEYGIQRAAEHGEQMAIIRRFDEDFKGKRGASMFQNHVENKVIERATKGEWTNVYYYSSRWFFCRYNDAGERETAEDPFCYAFSIAGMEHDKSSSYPNITTVLFDEFLTRSFYLPDEFILFMNVLSTIIRQRNNVKIFMCGNTVNQYSPYFSEMGLNHIRQMKQGDIDVYEYGNSGLRVAVEFSDTPSKNKPSDIYFAFNNPKLSMITGNGGVWEMNIYPHCPEKFTQKQILFIFFIKFDRDMLQCEVVNTIDNVFLFIHRKTTELKNTDKDLIFSTEYDPRMNWRRKITRPILPVEKRIAYLFQNDKVFYQDNEVGEIVRNYLMWCKKGE